MQWLPTLTPRRLRQLWYAPLLTVAMSLVLVRLLVMARLLDVHAFAEFSACLLVSSSFCMLGCLGLQPMLQREWPVNLVHGQKIRAVIRASQCNLVALVSAMGFLILAATGLSVAGLESQLLAVSVLHGVAQQAFLIATTESRSRGDALGYAQQQLVRAGLSLMLGAIVALTTASPLLVIATEAAVSATLALAVFRGILLRAALGWYAAGRLALQRMPRVRWRSALTMMVALLVAFATLNADRWVASHLLGAVGFAQYSFAAIVLAVAQAVQALVNATMYPLLARRYASAGTNVAFGLCVRAGVAFLTLGALIAVPVGVLVQYGVARWYPLYAEAAALVPLLLAVGVVRAADFWSSFLLIAGQERRLLVINLVSAVSAALVWLIWAEPWSGRPTTPWDIALLAALLSLFSGLASAAAAWRTQRQ